MDLSSHLHASRSQSLWGEHPDLSKIAPMHVLRRAKQDVWGQWHSSELEQCVTML